MGKHVHDDNVPLGPLTWRDRVGIAILGLAAGGIFWLAAWAAWEVTH